MTNHESNFLGIGTGKRRATVLAAEADKALKTAALKESERADQIRLKELEIFGLQSELTAKQRKLLIAVAGIIAIFAGLYFILK
jgi:hypothetical protein